MFLVVLAHVSEFVLLANNSHAFSFSTIFSKFRMPLFFFISGFVLYKKDFEWNAANTINFFKKKLFVQVLSPLLFLFLYVSIHEEYTFINALFNVNKYGYWFTFVLFIYFCFYISIQWLFRICSINNLMRDFLLLSFGLFIYFMTTHYVGKQSNNFFGLVSMGRWPFFLFFIIGTRVRKYYTRFEHILDNSCITFICLVIFIGFSFVPSLANISNITYYLLLRISGVIVVFAAFRKYQYNFKKDNLLGRSIQYVGRHTLEIYLIHFFFLITNMQSVLPDFSYLNSPFLEFILGCAISIIIIICCLLVSATLCESPIAAYYLFGQKKKDL